MSKHTKDSLSKLDVKDIDKEFWNKVEKEKKLFDRNKGCLWYLEETQNWTEKQYTNN